MTPWRIVTLALLKRSDGVHLQLTGILTVTMTVILSYGRSVLKDKLLTQEITDLSPEMEAVKLHTLKPVDARKGFDPLFISFERAGWMRRNLMG